MKRLLLTMFAAGICTATAGTISFTGDLRNDANVISCGSGCTLDASSSDGDYAQWAAVVDSFTVSTTSAMQAVTFSYGGGVNGAGTPIAEGGFEPYLSLFDAGGNVLGSTFFGTTCPAGANTNSVSGQCFDVSLDGGVLAPGTYQIAISAFENMSFAENFGSGTLADGFTGLGNLAPGEDLHYAFDVDLTPTAATPEASSSWLGALLAFAVICFFKRRNGGSVIRFRP
ncbi:MAG TPA: DVUA0089 family protein [Bryobacteraceae bacterium]|nr:DVUA0089 family protein [Bryobacteraceae bacterium]